MKRQCMVGVGSEAWSFHVKSVEFTTPVGHFSYENKSSRGISPTQESQIQHNTHTHTFLRKFNTKAFT